jgi:beta-lactam-binding protein with PASTA domain
VTYRNGRIEVDNGLCKDTSYVVFFAGHAPPTANCKRNEVEVPNVVGMRVGRARIRLTAQPLTPQLIYKPATAGEPIGVVLRQFPRTGTLGSYGRVTLVLAKALHGVVPKIVGLDVQRARSKLRAQKLNVTVETAPGKPGRVLAQTPSWGVAAAPGMTVRIKVGAAG